MSILSRYLRPAPSSSWKLWTAALALAGLSAWLGMAAYRWHLEAQTIHARSEKLQARQAALAAAKPTRSEMEERRRWEALKLERDFPWQRLFHAVERASSKDIELLEFQPDKRNRLIVLRGEAKDQDALVSYLELLSMQAGFSNVYLVHQQDVARDRLETVAFEIKASLVE